MTGFTPNEAFPYPQAADPFRVQTNGTGFPQQSRDLAQAIQAKINAAPSYVTHRPYFRMSLNTPVTVTPTSGRVPMDTIDVDTVGTICDLTRAPSGAFLTSGIWVVGAFLDVAPTQSTAPNFGTVTNSLAAINGSSLTRLAPLLVGNAPQYDGNGALENYLNTSFIVYSGPQTALTVSPTITFNYGYVVTSGGTGNITINFATMWGYWVSD